MTAPRRILMTGFDPFGGSAVNPSREALRALEAAPPEAVRTGRAVLSTAILPVVGGTAPGSAAAALAEAVARHRPDVIVCVGETGARDTVCVERTSVNQRHYRIADNAGAVVRDEAVVPGAPPALAATLPVEALVEAIGRAGVRVVASDDAGRFLCNEIMFHAIVTAQREGLRGAGFVHVPRLPEQCGDRPGSTGMPLEETAAALRAVVETLAC